MNFRSNISYSKNTQSIRNKYRQNILNSLSIHLASDHCPHIPVYFSMIIQKYILVVNITIHLSIVNLPMKWMSSSAYLDGQIFKNITAIGFHHVTQIICYDSLVNSYEVFIFYYFRNRYSMWVKHRFIYKNKSEIIRFFDLSYITLLKEYTTEMK